MMWYHRCELYHTFYARKIQMSETSWGKVLTAYRMRSSTLVSVPWTDPAKISAESDKQSEKAYMPKLDAYDVLSLIGRSKSGDRPINPRLYR